MPVEAPRSGSRTLVSYLLRLLISRQLTPFY